MAELNTATIRKVGEYLQNNLALLYESTEYLNSVAAAWAFGDEESLPNSQVLREILEGTEALPVFNWSFDDSLGLVRGWTTEYNE